MSTGIPAIAVTPVRGDVAPPKKEFDTREGRISANFGGAASFAQVSAHSMHRAAPPPPPDTAEALGEPNMGTLSNMVGQDIQNIQNVQNIQSIQNMNY